MKIAIAHDYLTQRGGAERLVLSICKAFPDAQLHTLFYEPGQTFPEYESRDIVTSSLNKISVFRKDPRKALPLLANASKKMFIDADLVIASSSGWAHAFPTRGKKIIYCHSPARWLYLEDDYLGEAGRFDPKRLALNTLKKSLTGFDQQAATTADMYIANSSVVKKRIFDVYGIESKLLFPPFSPLVAEGEKAEISDELTKCAKETGYYLVVSRLQPYKNVDKVIEAFKEMTEKRLVIVGKGPLREKLRSLAPENVSLLEGLSDAQMRWVYSNASALIAASYEDFGLTPLEAGAHGVPTIAMQRGGYLDTITEGLNGLFFSDPVSGQIRDAVAAFENERWSKESIKENALMFDESRFISKLQEFVDLVSR